MANNNRNNSPLSSIFFFIALIALFNGGPGALFPLMIVYFIARGVLKGQGQGNNRQYRRGQDYGRGREGYNKKTEYERMQRERERVRKNREIQIQQQREYEQRRRKAAIPKKNPYKQSGIKKFKEYDYDGAIEDFEKALTIDSTDISVHFNLACAYSLNEDKDKSFYHLSKSVALGFKDVKKIEEHDALAYIRIQPEFETFKENGYRIVNTTRRKEESNPGISGDLLDQLNRLQELRTKGVLTEEEFAVQKERLLK